MIQKQLFSAIFKNQKTTLYLFIGKRQKRQHKAKKNNDHQTSLTDFLVTGRGNHSHKFDKIKHILEFYPHLQYTLLGDDSQHDPYLYQDICKIFPVTVKAVYIRQTGIYKKKKVIQAINNIESLGVAVCYFKESSEAIAHSREIGLIK